MDWNACDEAETEPEPLELHFPEEEIWFYLERPTAEGAALRIFYRKLEDD